MLQNWCKDCGAPSERCSDAKHKHGWRTDFLLGGRRGKRIREFHEKRDEAIASESDQRTDFRRGKLFPLETQSKISFKELTDLWHNKHALVRLKTADNERYHLNALERYFQNKPITQLTHSDGEGFIQYSIKHGKRIGAINRDLHTLKSVFNWATKNHYLLTNPFAHVEQVKGDVHRVRWLSKEEFQTLVRTCLELDPPLADVVSFGVLTGFRKGNLERVTARDINGDFITASKTKSGKPYDVPISIELRDLLNKLAKGSLTGPLLDTTGLGKRFKSVVKAAGLWKGPRDPETVTLHTLRHTFASWYLKNGGDLYKLQKMLGHSSIVMTERYAHLAQKDMALQATLLNFDVLPKVELKVM